MVGAVTGDAGLGVDVVVGLALPGANVLVGVPLGPEVGVFVGVLLGVSGPGVKVLLAVSVGVGATGVKVFDAVGVGVGATGVKVFVGVPWASTRAAGKMNRTPASATASAH